MLIGEMTRFVATVARMESAFEQLGHGLGWSAFNVNLRRISSHLHFWASPERNIKVSLPLFREGVWRKFVCGDKGRLAALV